MQSVNIHLFNAVKNSDLDMVKQSVSSGADVMARDNDGQTPLHIVVSDISVLDSAEKAALISMLIEHGADVNAVDNRCVSVLSVAADNEIADLLIQYKAGK